MRLLGMLNVRPTALPLILSLPVELDHFHCCPTQITHHAFSPQLTIPLAAHPFTIDHPCSWSVLSALLFSLRELSNGFFGV